MKKVLMMFAAAVMFSVAAYSGETLKSPDGNLELDFRLDERGAPVYNLSYKGSPVVLDSRMGFLLVFNNDPSMHRMPYAGRFGGPWSLYDGFSMADSKTSSFDETWTPVWGEEAEIRNHYNELAVTLKQESGRIMIVRFRLYDDGLGFRYEFPAENALTYFLISEEVTEFALAGDHLAWWLPGDYDTQEYNYTESRLSEVRKLVDRARTANASQAAVPGVSVQTSLQMKTDDGLYVNIHEAEVVNFPTANLELDDENMKLRVWLTPDAQGVKGRMQAPCQSPWRTVMVVDDARKVLASRLILNLNEPCALEDVSWIHPVKYMGVWWEMITNKSLWSYTNDFPSVQLGKTDYSAAKPHGRHGANNENVRRYIDFAAENHFDALLIEGWNEGWEDWFGHQKDYVFDFVTPYPDFDLPGLNAYAHSKGIRLIMHHESSSSTVNYERHIDKAYDLMNEYGYDAVKSGYVGDIIPYGEHHYSQPIINHYALCIKKAAEKHIMVNAHEAVRPTGLCRTYPNMIGNESAMGTEFRSDINPGHTTILPFTRLQGGPMDYTPGIFEMDMSKLNPRERGHMRMTICNQLGLYVTFYSPLQMAADLPEHYAPFMDAFQFIKDVAVDWDKSLYLAAEPGAYVVTARHPKLSTLNKSQEGVASLSDGKKDALSGAARFVYALGEDATSADLEGAVARDVWYVGGITDESARDITVALDFLQPKVKYEAVIYADGPDADFETNPQSYTITRKTVTSKSKLNLHMARSGGFAISLREIRK
ncbi:MAG: glycoside hydrolase family 97 protein [Bacteroidales bacterium]|nr:glycoside hydrolase family 97 protein [Bacteroidales bacterium]MBQ5528622.1 glycoside hydrolase family 97 protein [Bacteroidales bacterium]